MYRVFLKICYLQLHIKEPVATEILIKKQKYTITIPRYFPLIDGLSHIDTTCEFYIDQRNPKFQVNVILCLENRRKLGGLIELNLSSYSRKQTISIESSLIQCPDRNSRISFQVTFMKSNKSYISIELISSEEILAMQNLIHLSQLQEQKNSLQSKNDFLEKQYKQLLQQNKQLYHELDCIENQEHMIDQSYQKQIALQKQKQSQSLINLEREKIRLAQILDIVFESGDSSLIELVQQKMLDKTQKEAEAGIL